MAINLNDLANALTGAQEQPTAPRASRDQYGTIALDAHGTPTVMLDGGEDYAPCTCMVGVHHGDRVLAHVVNHKIVVFANITAPTTDDATALVAIDRADAAAEAADAAGIAAASAQADATAAKADAATAKSAAQGAVSDAADAKAAATQAQADAQSAAQDAASAAASAQSAEEDAQAASTAATSAQGSAQTAQQAAQSAQSDAADAASAAQSAQDDATSAASSASAAATSASTAQSQAQAATTAANEAKADAATAKEQAASAVSDAATAKQAATEATATANGAVTALATVQGVVDQLETDVDELQVHVAMMDAYSDGHGGTVPAGLHVVPTGSGYFLVIANDGTYVYDAQSVLVTKFGESIDFSSTRPQRIGNDTAYVEYYDSDNDGIPDSIRIVGTNLNAEFSNFEQTVSETYATKDSVSGIDTRLTTAESSITQQAGQIAIKANASDVYTKQESTALLEVKANKATLTSEINASADTVKIDAARVNIEGAAIFTSGRLSQSSLDGAYDASGAASAAQAAAISAAAADATSKANAAKTAATNAANQATDTKLQSYSTTSQMNEAIGDAVDAIEVGGRNLLRGSAAFGTVGSVHGWVSNGTANTISSDVIGGVECFKVTRADANVQIASARTASRVNLEWGKTYIASCWMMFSEDISNVFADITPLHFHAGSVANTNVFDLDILYHGGGVSTYEIEPPSDYGTTIPANTWVRFVRKIVTANAAPSEEYPYPVFAPFVYGKIRKSTSATERTTWFRGFKFEEGNVATDWTPAPEDIESNAVKRTQRIYYRKNASGAPSTPSSWITQTGDVFGQWTAKVPRLTANADGTGAKYPYLYTCEQREMANGTLAYTTVLLDDSATIIDGGSIITGSVAANKLDVYDATIQKIRADAIDAASITIGQSQVTGLASALDGKQPAGDYATNANLEVANGRIDTLVEGLEQSSYFQQTDDGFTFEVDAAISTVAAAAGNAQDSADSAATAAAAAAQAAEDASRVARDYLTFQNGELTIGTSESDIRSVLTNVKFAFKTDAGDIAYFGLNDDGIWQMHIATAFVDDMLRFGDYAWIKRDNGNMSIKWLGA